MTVCILAMVSVVSGSRLALREDGGVAFAAALNNRSISVLLVFGTRRCILYHASTA